MFTQAVKIPLSILRRGRLVLLLLLLLSGVSSPAHAAVDAPGKGVSPEPFLNADGTVNLSTGFSGTFDLEGWNVQMDPQRGPVFAPTPLAPLDEWDDLAPPNGSLNGTVYALAVMGTDLYVGGQFTDVNNGGTVLGAADNIARWDGTNWSALGSDGAGNGSLNSTVYALAVNGTDLYAGGTFTNVNNDGTPLVAADYVARWDGTNWAMLGSNGAGDGSLGNNVLTLAVIGTDLYVGGNFSNVNNDGTVLTADYIARWDGSNWSALGSDGAGDGSLSSTVRALAVSGTDLYVGGDFVNVNNGGTTLGAADFVARWDGTNWAALGSNGAGNGSLNSNVLALAVMGTNLYVGGQFFNVNNGGTTLTAADYVTRWDGSNWSALGSNGAGNGSLNTNVLALAVSGTNLYVGGNFQNVNNGGTTLTAADYVVRWDGSNWLALGSNGAGNGSMNGIVYALAVSGTDLYVGGNFQNVNNGGTLLTAADFVVRWDGTEWAALSGGTMVNGPLNSSVNALAVMGTDLYVGGTFTNVNNGGTVLTAADYIARWDGTNWSALGSNGAINGSLNSFVNALAVIGTDLYVGGSFSNVNNGGTVLGAADYIARWDGTNWSALSSNGAGNGSLNGSVNVLMVSGANLYVGGYFADVNNGGTVLGAADRIARWDGSNWAALGSNGAGDGSLSNAVNALAVIGTELYVGGLFTDVNNGGTVLTAADWIVRWDGTNWAALGSNGAGNGSLNSFVNTLAVIGTDLYVGGNFSNVNNGGTVLGAADRIARWDGSNWAALGSNGAGDGSLSNVLALAVSGTDLYVGGNFQNVNNGGTVLGAADHLARWDGSNWAALSSNGAGNGSLNSFVNALAVSGTDLYVGGNFLNVNNDGTVLVAADYIAAYGIPNASLSIWDGGGGDNNWSTAANWVGDVVPGESKIVTFNSTSSKNAGIDAIFGGTVAGFNITAEYTGSITFGRALAVSGNYTQDGGHVVVDPAYAFTVNGSFSHIGGTLHQTRTVNNATVSFLEITNIGASVTKYRGVRLATVNNLGATLVSITAVDTSVGEYCTGTGGNSPAYAEHCYTITPTIDGAAQVRLWALTNQLNGITQANLSVYRNTGDSIWTELTSNRATGNDGSSYSYAEGDTPGFSHFLLGQTGVSPTVITVQNVARTVGPPVALWSGVLLLVMLTGAIFIARRRSAQK